MANPVTVLAPIRLAKGISEEELLKASHKFEKAFAGLQSGIIRRELVRTGDGEYIDIVQFRSQKDAEMVIAKEKASPACHEFFSIMDFTSDEMDIQFYESLVTY